MFTFYENLYGGVDICNNDEVVTRLNSLEVVELKNVIEQIQHRTTVLGALPDLVAGNSECEGFSLADFNSHLFSNDEIGLDEVIDRVGVIVSDKKIMAAIYSDYIDLLEDGVVSDLAVGAALENNISIRDVVGELLREKHPKVLDIGQWRVRVVEKGDLYGVENPVPWKDVNPCVEFYNMNVDKERFPEGRFTTGRYMIDRFLNPGDFRPSLEDLVKSNKGFNLHPAYPEWTVQPGDLNVIGAWLKAVQDYIERNTVKFTYRGEVDLPFGFNGLEKYSDYNSVSIGKDFIFETLSAFSSYFKDISVECFGEYDKGCGFSFSFSTTADTVTTDTLIKHAFKGLSYEMFHTDPEVFLDDALADAKERSQKNSSAVKSDKQIEIDK